MKLSNKEFNWLIIFALRYALGRMSSAPGIMYGLILDNLDDLTEMTRKTIIREIDYANKNGLLCEFFEVDIWLDLKKELEEEEAKIKKYESIITDRLEGRYDDIDKAKQEAVDSIMQEIYHINGLPAHVEDESEYTEGDKLNI